MTAYSFRVLKVAAATVPNYEVYWMAAPGPPEPIMFSVGLLRGGGRTVLINTGLPLDYAPLSDYWEAWFPPHRVVDYKRTEIALAEAGVTPDEVTHVLVTPLTAYTTGRLDLFPDAELVFGRRGWADLWAPEPYAHHLPRSLSLPKPALDYVIGPGEGRVRLVDDEAGEVLPGIRAWFAGGHHRSSMAYLVATERGTVAWCDGVFKYPNIEQGKPLGITESLEETLRSYARLRAEADVVVPPYDPEVFDRFPEGQVA
jgi:glyoxylase-like metal-dependent hydrolase (beta-lactamase superfamily II)